MENQTSNPRDEWRREFIKNHFEVVKQCIDTTLDELYDFRDALVTEEDEKNAESLDMLAKSHESLRKNLMNKELTEFNLEQIDIILSTRATILTKKAEGLVKAAEEMAKLASEYSNGFKPEISIVK